MSQAAHVHIVSANVAQPLPADPHNFSGAVSRTAFLSSADTDGMSGAHFSYAPGARSFWHIHTEEQVIIATEGVGIAFWDGLIEARRLERGDWWYVAKGVRHWHGASPQEPFSHLAVNTGGSVLWLGEVTDGEYQIAHTSTGATA